MFARQHRTLFSLGAAQHANVPTILHKFMSAPAASLGGRRFAADTTLPWHEAF